MASILGLTSLFLLSLPTAWAVPTADLWPRDAISTCLSTAGVPYDVQGATNWTQDVAPFNLRVPYTPAAIAVPTSTKHIQDAVSCGVKNGLKISAKCGGHSYASLGLGGQNGQLMIELDRMSTVTLKSDNTSVIQAGARLGHVATELYNQGKRAISHGTCPGVGLSGHALHGGYGMASHSHGLALDWITGATVVLANSTVVHASATENADLFWALRGAGSSFGIVSEYEFATFAAPVNVTYFTVSMSWNESQTVSGLSAVQDFAGSTDMPPELNMRVALSSYSTSMEGVYYGTVSGLNAVLAPLLTKIGGKISTAKTVGWMQGLNQYAYGQNMNPTHPYDMHETFYASSLTTPALSQDQLKAFASYKFHNTSTGGFFRNWWIQIDLHGGPNSAVANVSPTATSYVHRDRLLLFQFYDSIFSGSYPSNGFSLLQGFRASITKLAKSDDDWGMYINYADTQLTNDEAQKRYWGKNLAKLQSIKALVDPKEVFANPQSIRPAK